MKERKSISIFSYNNPKKEYKNINICQNICQNIIMKM